MLSYARKAALSPLWAAQLLTQTKSFARNPILGSERLNALGLHAARVQMAHRMAWSRRRRLAHLISAEDRAAFERDGFVVKRDFLPKEQFEALLREAKTFRTVAREMTEGDAVTRRIPFSPENLARLPAARALAEDPGFQGLLRYVGSDNTDSPLYFQTILSRVSAAAGRDPQTNFHADTFHPTVKAWLFLVDVEEADGPFNYVPGSHRLTPERLEWERQKSLTAARSPDSETRAGSFRVEREELKGLGLPDPVAFAVPANTLVVGDTYGFHARGASTRPSLRVEIFASGRRNPFLPYTGLDIGSQGPLKNRKTVVSWAFLDTVERFGLGRNVWRERRDVTAFDAFANG
ncbi:MAG TPA: phytanoyl-CoA dioxygenase family protein [Microvirga sp.]|jgi:hypothetical protein|nr:phytanoyl-CoA dioxygenase family protein [Microvirga sp.]